jgi:nucleoside-diphosphate-sugar epimerase
MAAPSAQVLLLGVEDALGLRAAELLAMLGCEVSVLGSGRGCGALTRCGVHVLRGDDFDAVEATVNRHAVVCNLARVSDAPQTPLSYVLRAPRRRLRRRLLDSIQAALAAEPAIRLVQRSTAALYADGGENWIAEDRELEPNGATAQAATAEHVAHEHRRRGGEAVLLRFAHPYGAADPDTERLLALARRGWQPFEGRADAYFPTIHLDDAASAVAYAVIAPSGTYNVGDDDPLTNTHLNTLIGAAVGREGLEPLGSPFRLPDAELLERACRLDARTFQRATGWRACVAPSARSWFRTRRTEA